MDENTPLISSTCCSPVWCTYINPHIRMCVRFLRLPKLSSPEKAKSEYESSAGHSHSHASKEKDKARMKKKDDKSYRPPSKHLLGELFAHTCIEPLR